MAGTDPAASSKTVEAAGLGLVEYPDQSVLTWDTFLPGE